MIFYRRPESNVQKNRSPATSKFLEICGKAKKVGLSPSYTSSDRAVAEPLILIEYHLVAGGEELFLETGLLAPVKQEDSCDINVLSPADTDDSFLTSPITPSTTGFSPPPLSFEDHSGLLQMPSDNSQPASPVGSTDSHLVGPLSTPLNSIARGRSTSLPGLHRRYTAPISSPLAPRPASSSFDVQTYHHLPWSLSSPGPSSIYHVDLRSTHSGTSSGSSSLGYEVEPPIKEENSIYYDSPQPSPPISNPLVPNRLSCINLFAEGMQPFCLPLAALTSASDVAAQPPPRLLIRIKITLPSIDDIHGSPTLHGIHGTLSFTRPWITSATCVTDVYAANVHHSRDIATLQPPTIDSPLGECTASLPESELTRCRWLDSGKCLRTIFFSSLTCPGLMSDHVAFLAKQTSIYQRVVVDNDTMAVIVYDLDRKFCDNSPFAEVVGFQKYRVNSEKPQNPAPVTPSPTYSSYPYGFASQTHCIPRTRYPEQTSLSCALTPIGGRPISKSPLTCTSQAPSMLF